MLSSPRGIGILIVLGFLGGSPAFWGQAPSDTARAGEERPLIERELKRLRDRLAALRSDRAVKPDHWADADIFVKGIVWALRYEPQLNPKDLDLVRKALLRARQRIEALAEGRQPWAARKGRVVRGFVSTVDGSTQPYGLVIPAGYDAARPTRLDVVLHGSRRSVAAGELQFMTGFDHGDEGGQPGPDTNYLELHPLGRLGENAYRFAGETDVFEAIEAVGRNYRIDRNRIILRGTSLGGVGTWQLGLKHPDRFVARAVRRARGYARVFAGAHLLFRQG